MEGDRQHSFPTKSQVTVNSNGGECSNYATRQRARNCEEARKVCVVRASDRSARSGDGDGNDEGSDEGK